MNKETVYLSVIVSLLQLFVSCDVLGPASELEQDSRSDGKVAVRLHIGADGIRTVRPAVVLSDVTKWILSGGKDGAAKTPLKEFAAASDTIYLEAGSWDFTLDGYNASNALILSGSLSQTITAASNSLTFTVAPVLGETGTVKLIIELPSGSGITSAQVYKDGTKLDPPLSPSSDRIKFEGTYAAGVYFFSIRLLKDSDVYGVVSELVYVRANLTSEKTYTLTENDLNIAYLINYHLWDGTETHSELYRQTDGAFAAPPVRPGFVFKGWYTENSYTTKAIQLDTGSTNRDFYAKWLAVPTDQLASLLAFLSWVKDNAEEGDAYGFMLSADESIAPQPLSYDGQTVGITLIGDSTERKVSLSSEGSLFTVEDGVTLTLGSNVTLQGRSSNKVPLVQVNGGGTLVMENGSKITGNNAYFGTLMCGGVYVSGGTFTMSGGEISGNSADSDSRICVGGVYMDGGTFTMSGGKISGNSINSGFRDFAGGVYVSGGTFTMSGGEISGNSNPDVSTPGGTFYDDR
jgi:uncharacterized repeat protein (TIGR02543 family)